MRILLIFGISAILAHGQGSGKLIWSDEFDGAANSAPDASKWTYDLGGGGWGNHELEVYTDSRENSFLDGKGLLVIRAIKTPAGGYTSGRLKTQGKFDVTYGRIEARMKLPFGQGIWPAFWMLGSNIKQIGWPACGEIDIMENIGKEPHIVHGTVHGPGYSGGKGIGEPFVLPATERFADAFHTYSVDWSPERIRFFADGKQYKEVTPEVLPKDTKWVFNTPFFLLLNLAVGGAWPGSPDASTTFPQSYLIDYVRVYQDSK